MRCDIEIIRDWVAAAKVDGWDVKPTYAPQESEDRAAKGEKDGFIFQAIMRPGVLIGNKDDASLSVWGPDRLAITVPIPYGMDEIRRRLRMCMRCGADGEMDRVGFAGRYCQACQVIERPKQEYRGWTS